MAGSQRHRDSRHPWLRSLEVQGPKENEVKPVNSLPAVSSKNSSQSFFQWVLACLVLTLDYFPKKSVTILPRDKMNKDKNYSELIKMNS